jgi:flagellar hook-associated protein FlgK
MSDLLAIGTSATQLYQKALTTVSNNVANLNSVGYSRQEAVLTENTPAQYGVHYLGGGAFLEGIKRSYDQFIEQNLRTSASEVATQRPLVRYTNRLIDMLGSEQNALAPAFDRFFNVAEQLSLNADSIPLRVDLLSAADFLAGRFRNLDQQLRDLDTESGRDMTSLASQINRLAGQLASVNQQLQKNTVLEAQAPALLDQRDRLLNELAGFTGLHVTEAANGEVDISIGQPGNLTTLVSRGTHTELSVEFPVDRPGSQHLVLDKYGRNLTLSGISRGELGGLATFRDDVLAPLMFQLDVLAESFVNEVNAAHRSGMTLASEAGGDLFTLTRQFRVDNGSQQPVAGVRIQEAEPPALQEHDLSVTWFGGEQWQVLDHRSNRVQSLRGSVQGDALELNVAGLTLRFEQLPLPGNAMRVRSDSQAAQGIGLALTDPRALAAAVQYEVTQDIDNAQSLATRLSAVPDNASPLTEDILSLAEFSGRNRPISLTTSRTEPALRVPAGLSEFQIEFLPEPGSTARIDLFSARFNHLLGDSKAGDDAALAAMQPRFDSAERYLETNRTAGSAGSFSYRGLELFYGHRAAQFTQSVAIPAVVQPVNTNLIDAGDLVLNGTSLPALRIAQGASLTAQDIADWVNGSGSAVTASVVTLAMTDSEGNPVTTPDTGEPMTHEVVRFSRAMVEWRFGAQGTSGDLALLGLSTGLYGSGTVPEDLLVYIGSSTPATDPTPLQVQVSAGALAASGSAAPGALDDQFTVSFSQPAGQPLRYEVRDANGIRLAMRDFDMQRGVALPGFTLRFDQTPAAGDEFTVAGNRDASGDNRNLLALIDLRNAEIVNQQTVHDYYATIVNTIGNVQKISALNLQASEIIHDQAVNEKAVVAGVNLDQEAADLIRFQQAYQAAAQIITTSIKLFDTLLSSSR